MLHGEGFTWEGLHTQSITGGVRIEVGVRQGSGEDCGLCGSIDACPNVSIIMCRLTFLGMSLH